MPSGFTLGGIALRWPDGTTGECEQKGWQRTNRDVFRADLVVEHEGAISGAVLISGDDYRALPGDESEKGQTLADALQHYVADRGLEDGFRLRAMPAYVAGGPLISIELRPVED